MKHILRHANEVRDIAKYNDYLNVDSDIVKINQAILEKCNCHNKHLSNDNLSVDLLFDRFYLFDVVDNGVKINYRGQAIKQYLEIYGYQVYVREDRWNDGPDFVVYWGAPDKFDEKFKDYD